MVSCNEIAEIGFRTCLHPDHRKLKNKYTMTSKAMFQLRHRLQRSYQMPDTSSTGHIEDSGADGDQEIEVTEEDCNGKPTSGNQKFRACFGHRRTHNDELCVASCGVVLGRTTFYGSEAPSAVRVCPYTIFSVDFELMLYPGFSDGVVPNTKIPSGGNLV